MPLYQPGGGTPDAHATSHQNGGSDEIDVTGLTGAGSVENLWTMSTTSSVTLTNNTDTLVTFDAAQIDGGGSVIDLANDRFVAPATGFYLASITWIWEGTAPLAAAYMAAKVGGSLVASIGRLVGTPAANQGATSTQALSLTSGDFVTCYINPGAATGVTARGNASVHLRTSFTLVRIT